MYQQYNKKTMNKIKKLFLPLLVILLLIIFYAMNSTKNTIALIETNYGTITAELSPKVPETYKNFVTLAKEGKYNGVPFHRVIGDFMIQTGDFENQNGTGGHSYKGPGTTIDEEFDSSLKHTYGALSMAKTALPSTTGSQFFIVQNKNGTSWLDNQHSVFGYVVSGMEVVEDIAALPTDINDRPLKDAFIISVDIQE